MMMGAPVFALAGYAAASLVIPRGFACRCLFLARAKTYHRGNAARKITAGYCRAQTHRRGMQRKKTQDFLTLFSVPVVFLLFRVYIKTHLNKGDLSHENCSYL
jgi:hypothetical protein